MHNNLSHQLLISQSSISGFEMTFIQYRNEIDYFKYYTHCVLHSSINLVVYYTYTRVVY